MCRGTYGTWGSKTGPRAGEGVGESEGVPRTVTVAVGSKVEEKEGVGEGEGCTEDEGDDITSVLEVGVGEGMTEEGCTEDEEYRVDEEGEGDGITSVLEVLSAVASAWEEGSVRDREGRGEGDGEADESAIAIDVPDTPPAGGKNIHQQLVCKL